MNKPLRRIAIFCGLLVLTLLIRDNWLQYVQADELKEDEHNRRVAIERYASPRGDIIVDGKAITGHATTEGDFKYKRTYKDGAMWAPVTGYVSQAFGATQLESIDDGILTGNDDRLFFRNTLDMITGEKREGGNVVTTLNSAAQKAAYNGLKKQGAKGAVVAIEPSTGKILSMASYPSYDPTSIAGSNDAAGEAWNGLQKKNNPDDPMLNRALREAYPPGSTFKVVTAAAALEHGKYTSADEKTRRLPAAVDHARHHRAGPLPDGRAPTPRPPPSARRCASPATPCCGHDRTTSATARDGQDRRHQQPRPVQRLGLRS
ncbi:Peptidoglycan D,D-transpeptidase MrdA [Streptomyces tendae]